VNATLRFRLRGIVPGVSGPPPVGDFEARLERSLKTLGLVAGPLLAAAVYLWNPGDHAPEARRLLGILALAVCWWITEAIPLPATALLAAALAIVTGVAPARQVLAPFADPVIFLFLGSFLLAEAVSRYGLAVRIAAWLLALPVFGRTGGGRMAAFATASAAISTVISNTASAALMTPIALGALGERRGERPSRADSGVLLMIAYGASIGGMATIIGTPPNLLVAGFLERLAGVRVTFTGWLAFGFPIALVLLLVSLALTRLTIGRGALMERLPEASAPQPGEATAEVRAGARYTVLAFSLAFLLWLSPSLAQGLLGHEHPFAAGLVKHLPEAGVALLCAALLFVAPVSWRKRRFALAWADGQRVNWGVLLLFGGGLSLGTLGEATGIARWAGEGIVASGLATSPESFMLLAVVTAVTVSEFASNTASATLLVPIVVAAAQQAGFDPVPPALAAGLAATGGFVFPVSTPPNAIVYGTGRVPLTHMIRAGALLDVACVAVVWLGMLLLRPLLPRASV
jgi:solute carrier family 13 (sodium-dependent dicarboxylate transporter), member 2/3/5